MKIIWMLLMSSGSGSGPTSHTFILSEMTKIAPLVRNIERIRNFHIDIYIYIYISTKIHNFPTIHSNYYSISS